MLGIRLGNIDLDMPEDSKLSIEWVSTLMNDSAEFLGSFSYPFLLPLTDKNKAALGNAHLPENRLARQEVTVLLTVFSRPWKVVNMLFEITSTGFDADLQIDNGEFASLISEVDLPSLFAIYNDGALVDFDWINIYGDIPDARYATILDSCQNPGKYPWVFFPIRNEAKFGTVPEETDNYAEFDYINRWNDGFFYNTIDLPTQKKTFYSPALYLKWVVQNLCIKLGFEPVGSFFTDEFINSLVIYNTGCYDMDTVFMAPFKFAPARHLPRIKPNEFIKALRQDLRLAIYFDSGERKAWFEFSKDILESKSKVSIADHVDLDTLKIKRNENKLFKLDLKIDSSDNLYKSFPYTKSYLIGSGKKPTTVTMGTGTTYMRLIDNPDTEAEWRTPWAQQLGNVYSAKAFGSEAYNDPANLQEFTRNEFALRLLSYKGMAEDGNGDLYPYATSDELSPNETELYDYSLKPGGAKGLLAKFNTAWYRFLLETEQHQVTAYMPESKLNLINPLTKVEYLTKSQVGISSIFDKLNFEADDKQGLISAKFTMYPHFNISALRPATVNEFIEGDPSAPDDLFIKLSILNIHEDPDYKHREGYRFGDVWVDFFLDEEATIPKPVTNQKIKVMRKFEGLKVALYKTEIFEYTINTASQILVGNATLHFHKTKRLTSGEKLENYYYGIEPSTAAKMGYKILAPTEGTFYAKMW